MLLQINKLTDRTYYKGGSIPLKYAKQTRKQKAQ
jgi:hypothetical protein